MQPKDVLVHLESGKHRIKEVLEYKNPDDFSQYWRVRSPLSMNDLMNSQLQRANQDLYQYTAQQNAAIGFYGQSLGSMLGGQKSW